MAPPFKRAAPLAPKARKFHLWNINDAWWKDAWAGRDDISVQYKLDFGKDIITPGTFIKMRHDRSTYAFRCLAHNIPLDTTWIDCVEVDDGTFHSFPVEKLKGIIKPKRSRRKKANA